MEQAQVEAQEQEKSQEPADQHPSDDRLITRLDPDGMASEDYRILRTSLLYASVDRPPKVVVMTSPGPQEGKSTSCANLGVALAQAGKSTLIMDCDFRRPSMHKIFGLRNFRGVVNVLGGDNSLQDICQEPVPGLKVATVGPLPHHPAELLGSMRFAELIDQVRKEFDYVLIDTPPAGLVSDPMILASQADGVLLVLDARKTRKVSLRKVKRSLEAVGANILGTVMNNVKATKGGLYSNYTY